VRLHDGVNQEGAVKLAVAGDCSNWNQTQVTQDDIPAEIRNTIRDCDIFIFNLEGPLINDTLQPESFVKSRILTFILKKCGKFQPLVTNTDQILDVLNLTDRNVACLANNHMLDAGAEGLVNTMEVLQSRNYLCLGAGKDSREASRPLILEVRGKRIGVLNYNFIGWRKFGFFIDPFAAGDTRPGVNHGTRKKVVRDIDAMKSDVDYLIVGFHMGKVLHRSLSSADQKFVQSLKADLVVIHHPHISQPGSSSHVFSLGDFLFMSPRSLQNRDSKYLVVTVGEKPGERGIAIDHGLPAPVRE